MSQVCVNFFNFNEFITWSDCCFEGRHDLICLGCEYLIDLISSRSWGKLQDVLVTHLLRDVEPLMSISSVDLDLGASDCGDVFLLVGVRYCHLQLLHDKQRKEQWKILHWKNIIGNSVPPASNVDGSYNKHGWCVNCARSKFESAAARKCSDSCSVLWREGVQELIIPLGARAWLATAWVKHCHEFGDGGKHHIDDIIINLGEVAIEVAAITLKEVVFSMTAENLVQFWSIISLLMPSSVILESLLISLMISECLGKMYSCGWLLLPLLFHLLGMSWGWQPDSTSCFDSLLTFQHSLCESFTWFAFVFAGSALWAFTLRFPLLLLVWMRRLDDLGVGVEDTFTAIIRGHGLCPLLEQVGVEHLVRPTSTCHWHGVGELPELSLHFLSNFVSISPL